MAKAKRNTLYVCDNCGEEYIEWQGRCNVCGEWNTIKEVRMAASTSSYGSSSSTYSGKSNIEPKTLKEVANIHSTRILTGIKEMDRVLGGGIVEGSLVLLGGDPGIGKSTIVIQMAASVKTSKKILYVSGEESVAQIKMRADRLGLVNDNIELVSHNVTHDIEQLVYTNPDQYGLLIIDSIQTLYDPSFPSTPGSIVQVRENALRVLRLAKDTGIPVIMVGHITKEGTVAGPRTLEHLVDVVLYLEGDSEKDLRVLRGVKNRFGNVNEVGLFSMEENGLVEVVNPAEYLLKERISAPGTVLGCVLEGTRPLLVEIQALVSPSNFGYPKRTASGLDLNRLNILLAVLQKRAGVDLSSHDVFINIVGGLKVKDPAVDAAVCVALAGAYKNKAISDHVCVIGEVGLAGEIRTVYKEKQRIKEIEKLGYSVVQKQKDLKQLTGLLIH